MEQVTEGEKSWRMSESSRLAGSMAGGGDGGVGMMQRDEAANEGGAEGESDGFYRSGALGWSESTLTHGAE